MIGDAVGVIQAIVDDRLRGFKTAELGVVTAVHSHESGSDKDNYECDVRLRDSDLELKYVAVATDRIGSVAVPNLDDLVLVTFLRGDPHSAVISGRVYNDKDRPPESKAGERVYVSPDSAQSGVRRLYCEFPNGNKVLLDDDTLKIEMGKTTVTVNHDGDVTVDSSGKVMVKSQSKATVEAPQIELVDGASHPVVFGDELMTYLNQLLIAYQTHTHPGQMAGPLPVTPMTPVPALPTPTPSLLSTKVKAG